MDTFKLDKLETLSSLITVALAEIEADCALAKDTKPTANTVAIRILTVFFMVWIV